MIAPAASSARISSARSAWMIALAVLMLLYPLVAPAVECRAFDAAHGGVTFETVDSALPVRGRFRHFDGEVCLTGDSVTSVDVRLEPGSVDTGLFFLDAILRDEAFFAVAAHPYAAFTSDRISRDGEVLTVAHGSLSLKDVTRPVDVPFTLERDAAGLAVSGALVFERAAYHVGTTGVWARADWLGGSVRITFRARLAPADATLKMPTLRSSCAHEQACARLNG